MRLTLLLAWGLISTAFVWSGRDKVVLVKTPDDGIQPQAVFDSKGTIHLIYFKGHAKGGNLFYVARRAGDQEFSKPIRVNSHPESAIAMGTVRGAHLALGKGGRIHVAWMGSQSAKPRGPSDATPMLYTRLNDAGTAFEPQRNLIQFAVGLDGGASVAADDSGNVYVTWHAEADVKGEDRRQVWIAHSADEGKTFAKETSVWSEPTGVCACCGMRAFVDSRGRVYVLYRSAKGRKDGIPVWGLASVVAHPDGSFTVLY